MRICPSFASGWSELASSRQRWRQRQRLAALAQVCGSGTRTRPWSVDTCPWAGYPGRRPNEEIVLMLSSLPHYFHGSR